MSLNFGQNLFPPRNELFTNYNYYDIADGVGYKIYYGAEGDNGEYIVTPNQVYSERIHTLVEESVTSTYVKKIDIDFDLTFNVPKNIKGKLLVNVPVGVYETQVEDIYFYVVIKANHYDGSTETLLATGTSRAFFRDDTYDPDLFSQMALCKCDITTLKHFKKGETLRLTLEVWAKSGDAEANSVDIGIGHDPYSREDIAYGNLGPIIEAGKATRMEIHIPFKLDI